MCRSTRASWSFGSACINTRLLALSRCTKIATTLAAFFTVFPIARKNTTNEWRLKLRYKSPATLLELSRTDQQTNGWQCHGVDTNRHVALENHRRGRRQGRKRHGRRPGCQIAMIKPCFSQHKKNTIFETKKNMSKTGPNKLIFFVKQTLKFNVKQISRKLFFS